MDYEDNVYISFNAKLEEGGMLVRDKGLHRS